VRQESALRGVLAELHALGECRLPARLRAELERERAEARDFGESAEELLNGARARAVAEGRCAMRRRAWLPWAAACCNGRAVLSGLSTARPKP